MHPCTAYTRTLAEATWTFRVGDHVRNVYTGRVRVITRLWARDPGALTTPCLVELAGGGRCCLLVLAPAPPSPPEAAASRQRDDDAA